MAEHLCLDLQATGDKLHFYQVSNF